MAKISHLYWFIVFIFYSSTFVSKCSAQGCDRRDYGQSSFVCVCNATYCDTVPNIGSLTNGQAFIISSTKADARFQPANLQFIADSGLVPTITIDASLKYQTMLGFGGAFTDATGINLARLSTATERNFIKSYFSPDGIEFNVGRVPIAGCDYSPRTYSYDDYPVGSTLSNFSLQAEDFAYKMPVINAAKRASNRTMRLFASPWSSPKWMKSNNDFIGQGYLLPEYYQVWADYFVRFLEEYKKQEIEFWGVTAQNEPTAGTEPGYQFNCIGWNAQNQSIFVGSNLGPTMASKGFGDVKIMVHDDQRGGLFSWTQTILNNAEAAKYVSGSAVHWYDRGASYEILTQTHNLLNGGFILSTEACQGFSNQQISVQLGSWERLESYASDIIQNINNWVVGWVDWNLALNERGGPNWAGFSADAAVIISDTEDEFYKNPMFYALGHFSKYVPEGSVRIGFQVTDNQLSGTAFLQPDGKRTVILLNTSENVKQIVLSDTRGTLQFTCPARSIHTIVYP